MLKVYMVEDKDGDTLDGWFDDDKEARRVAREVNGVLVEHEYAFVSARVIEDYTTDEDKDSAGERNHRLYSWDQSDGVRAAND